MVADSLALSMEPFDLELSKFDVKVVDEIFEDISTLRHKFSGLLVRQHLFNVLIWTLKVREEKNENFLGVARNLHQVNDITDLMEVPIENMSVHFNATLVVANSHWGRSFFRHDVDFIRAGVKGQPCLHALIC